jgi:hypothetical protein
MWTIWTKIGETDITWLTRTEAIEILKSWPNSQDEPFALDDNGNWIKDDNSGVLEWWSNQ